MPQLQNLWGGIFRYFLPVKKHVHKNTCASWCLSESCPRGSEPAHYLTRWKLELESKYQAVILCQWRQQISWEDKSIAFELLSISWTAWFSHWYLHQLCRALFTCSWSSKCKCWVWQCSLLHAEKEKMVLRERMRLLQAWKIEETVLHMIKASYCLVLLYTMSLRSVSQRSHYSLWILIVFGDVDCLLHQARAWLSLKAIEKSFFKTLKFLFLQDGFNQSYVK